ncbi:MAG: efflux transporter outer membrane subunit [Verrucomicrobiota bacterium]|nr:efflux transporter outer membrane subunit [Verrucomicrobiota bacterium]
MRSKKTIFLLFLLHSCLRMSEEEQKENLIPMPSMDWTAQNSMQTSFFSEGRWPKELWWEVFDSAVLNQMMREAIANNPNLHSVEQKILRAKERATVIKATLYPLVNFNADGLWQMVSSHGIQRAYNPDFPKKVQFLNMTLDFSYEFDFWDKYRNLYHSALSLAFAEQAEYDQALLILSATLSRTYFALRANLVKRQIYQDLFSVRRRLLLLNSLRMDAAIDDLRIVLERREAAEQAEQWIYAIEDEIAVDRHLLNILMGKGPDEPIETEYAFPELPPALVIPETLSLDLISRRPDLAAQLWRLESLAQEVGSARAHFFPNINLGSFLGLSSILYNALFKPSSYEQGIEPSIGLPVYPIWDIQANLDAKRAEYQAAVFAYNDMILKSAQDVVDSLVFARAIYGEKEQQEAIVQQASCRLVLAEDRVTSGLDNALEMLHWKEELLLKQLDDINLAYNRYVAAISLIRSLGGGYNSKEALCES